MNKIIKKNNNFYNSLNNIFKNKCHDYFHNIMKQMQKQQKFDHYATNSIENI